MLTSVLRSIAGLPSCSLHSYFGGVGTEMEVDFGGFSCLLTCFDLGGGGIEG